MRGIRLPDVYFSIYGVLLKTHVKSKALKLTTKILELETKSHRSLNEKQIAIRLKIDNYTTEANEGAASPNEEIRLRAERKFIIVQILNENLKAIEAEKHEITKMYSINLARKVSALLGKCTDDNRLSIIDACNRIAKESNSSIHVGR